MDPKGIIWDVYLRATPAAAGPCVISDQMFFLRKSMKRCLLSSGDLDIVSFQSKGETNMKFDVFCD